METVFGIDAAVTRSGEATPIEQYIDIVEEMIAILKIQDSR